MDWFESGLPSPAIHEKLVELCPYTPWDWNICRSVDPPGTTPGRFSAVLWQSVQLLSLGMVTSTGRKTPPNCFAPKNTENSPPRCLENQTPMPQMPEMPCLKKTTTGCRCPHASDLAFRGGSDSLPHRAKGVDASRRGASRTADEAAGLGGLVERTVKKSHGANGASDEAHMGKGKGSDSPGVWKRNQHLPKWRHPLPCE